MYGYKNRFIPQEHTAEVANLYHLSRTALSGKPCGRWERLNWVVKEYCKLHPEQSQGGAYKDIDCITTL